MDIKDFLPQMRRMIQGPLDYTMLDALGESSILFCKSAQVLRESSTIASAAVGDKHTIVSTNATLKPWGTVTVFTEEGELKRGRDYTQASRSEIVFNVRLKNVTVVAYFYPTDKAQLPDVLEEYKKGICAGAASELYVIPMKEWTDPQRADFYSKDFVTAYRAAWREVENDFGNFQNPTPKTDYWC